MKRYKRQTGQTVTYVETEARERLTVGGEIGIQHVSQEAYDSGKVYQVTIKMLQTCFTVWPFKALALTPVAPSTQGTDSIVHTRVGFAQVHWHFSLCWWEKRGIFCKSVFIICIW